jgi:hypothetical protein
LTTATAESDQLSELAKKLGDWRWRLHNLYWIVDESGKRIKFVPNPEQMDLLDNLHDNNIVLKARQLGFTTLIDILALDQAVFNKDFAAAIIAHGLEPAEKIFRNKVKFAWDNLPAEIKRMNPTVKETTSELVFASGSSIFVGTSARSGTLQFLHISEYGKICRRFPERATEIKTGSLPSVHAGGLVFIESTAEGTGGHFYEMIREAEKQGQRKPNAAEFKLHFYPWWKKESYRLDPEGVAIESDVIDYFNELEEKHKIFVDDAQVAWYAIKRRLYKDNMKQEYPSTAEEAFSGAMEERYFAVQMTAARKQGRIKAIPTLPNRRVNLFLDIGRDTTAIWFHQYAALEHRFIDYLESAGKTLDWYAVEIQKRGYLLGNIYLPHDAGDQSVVTTETAEKKMKSLFPNVKIRVVPRTPQKHMAIDAARSSIAESYFHETACAKGIEGLENYRKKWNEAIGNWSDTPVHDSASHPADAYMQFAQGWNPSHEGADKKRNDVIAEQFTPLDPDMGY